jgi:PAS domain S-box-containing protein
MDPLIIDGNDQRNAILAAIIESSEDAIISKDLNSIITSWNKAAECMFGYTEKEAVGKHIFLIIPPELQSEEEMIISNLRQGKKISHFETERVTKFGKRIHLSLTISPIYNAQSEIVGASKIARDITRQKEDELIIRRYTQQLEIIHEVGKKIATKLDIAAILKSVVESTTQLSQAQLGAFFYHKRDLRSTDGILYAFEGLPKELFERSAASRELSLAIFDSPATVQKNLIGSGASESFFPFNDVFNIDIIKSYLSIAVFSKNGDVIGRLYFAHHELNKFTNADIRIVQAISSMAAILLENASLYDQVKILSNRKDEFIGFASHELRNPLGVLMGYLELLKTDRDSFDLYVPKIEIQALRLRALISDLLDISHIESGDMPIRYGNTTLQSLLKEGVDSINPEGRKIVINMPAAPITLFVDKDKVIQVLTNILGNAVKYSGSNITINISAAVKDHQVEITIKDEGFGISADDLPNIFNQFYRSGRNAHIQGMGIGLYISREIIKKHGGEIRVTSTLGKGSVFLIVLPL